MLLHRIARRGAEHVRGVVINLATPDDIHIVTRLARLFAIQIPAQLRHTIADVLPR